MSSLSRTKPFVAAYGLRLRELCTPATPITEFISPGHPRARRSVSPDHVFLPVRRAVAQTLLLLFFFAAALSVAGRENTATEVFAIETWQTKEDLHRSPPRFDKKDKLTVAVELTDFSVYYSQGLADTIAADLKEGKSEVVCEAAKLIKLSKDKAGRCRRRSGR